jgi:hypothetical protein
MTMDGPIILFFFPGPNLVMVLSFQIRGQSSDIFLGNKFGPVLAYHCLSVAK